MDQSVAIQETLAEGEYCPQAVQGVLCEGDSRQSRLLGLVRYRLEHGSQEHALFLYTHRRMAITGDDVSLDQIVPVSRDFTLEEVSPDGELYILGSDVTIQLDTAELSLVFQLPFGSQTRMFLHEVARACPGFDPTTRDPEFLWLSRYRCAEPELELPTPRGCNSAPGTWPGYATIGGGRYPSRKERWGLEETRPQGAGSVLFWGGATEKTGFRLMERLEEAGREMSAAAGSRECDSAGPAGGGKLGSGAGPGAAVGPALGWAGSAVWPVDARDEDQSPGGPPEAGTLGQKFCDVLLRRA
uniref:Inositol polyphosphate-5-phosphatase B n=1 Tax=Macaca nemestrina TaxID=9545 RepID=A0A2K6C8T5_MACNE